MTRWEQWWPAAMRTPSVRWDWLLVSRRTPACLHLYLSALLMAPMARSVLSLTWERARGKATSQELCWGKWTKTKKRTFCAWLHKYIQKTCLSFTFTLSFIIYNCSLWVFSGLAQPAQSQQWPWTLNCTVDWKAINGKTLCSQKLSEAVDICYYW